MNQGCLTVILLSRFEKAMVRLSNPSLLMAAERSMIKSRIEGKSFKQANSTAFFNGRIVVRDGSSGL